MPSIRWQSACLLGKGLLSGQQNLVYTAPTGGGKSLVADVLLLKQVIESPKKAILVLPYVALVQEKLRWLRSLVEGVTRTNDADMADGPPLPTCADQAQLFGSVASLGDPGPTSTGSDFDVAVCTIEKANSLVNTAIEEGRQGDLGVVVLDELHMANDEGRGYLLELLGTKLMVQSPANKVQIIGMSGTLPNPQLLAQWLPAKFYVAKYRPIAIEEHLVYENAIYSTANAKEFFRTASQITAEDHVPTPRPMPQRKIKFRVTRN